MKAIFALTSVLLFGPLGQAQMTLQQKLEDFGQLAGVFSKHYAFTEWKRQAVHYDSLNLAPWISRINQSQNDLDFFEICMEYVAANQDSHTGFILPTTFEAALGFTADIYDGKVLIDNIDRKQLDATLFPAQVGDELVSVDGQAVADMISSYVPFINDANARTARRFAALLATDRLQGWVPRAPQVGDSATVVVRRQAGGTETYTLPWHKSGLAYTSVGPAPDPQGAAAAARTRAADEPAWKRLFANLRNYRARHTRADVIKASDLKPVFALPDTFVPRLGASQFDDFYTGTFTANGLTIGYLRYPQFNFFLDSALQKEVNYFESRTDGLIIDMMGNPGGDVCSSEHLLQFFMPDGFRTFGWSVRADWELVQAFQDAVESAILDGTLTDDEIAQMQAEADAVRLAYSQNRGFTDPLPLCSTSLDVDGIKDKLGHNAAYTKPIMVLADELTVSAAEMFTAIMQDERRALIYGMRTDGGGGTLGFFNVGIYMEAGTTVAQTKAVRKNQIQSPEFPAAPYVENIAILPDKLSDYMTADNLMQQGKPFVAAFTQAMLDYINSKKQ